MARLVARRWAIAFVTSMALAAVLAPPPPARADDGWVGKRVITKFGTVLKVGNQVVDDAKRSTNLALGHDRNDFRVYRVGQVNGPWLWLVAEGSGARGWAKVEQVILYDQAIDYITTEIRANPQTANYYNDRGNVWEDKKEYDIAIADYNEAIRLEPGESIYWNNRGNAWRNKREYDKAIADYNEALRLDPKYASAFVGRGYAWRNKREYDKAIADYDEAIRLEPAYARPYYDRAVVEWERGRDEEAVRGAKETIEKDGWNSLRSTYATLIGHLAARRAGKEEAKRFLDEAKARGKAEWPSPIVAFFRGELGADGLLASAVDVDKKTEAHCFLGLDLALRGKTDEAVEHLRWVKENGNTSFVEYGLALVELDRLARRQQTAGAGRP